MTIEIISIILLGIATITGWIFADITINKWGKTIEILEITLKLAKDQEALVEKLTEMK